MPRECELTVPQSITVIEELLPFVCVLQCSRCFASRAKRLVLQVRHFTLSPERCHQPNPGEQSL